MKKFLNVSLCVFIVFSLMACSLNNPEESTTPEVDPHSTAEVPKVTATLEETTLVDNEFAKISALNLLDISLEDSPYRATLDFRFENKTNKPLYAYVQLENINGIAFYAFVDCMLNPGESTIVTTSLSNYQLITSHLVDIATIDVLITICDADYVSLSESTASLETSIASTYDQQIDERGEVLVDDEFLKVIYQGITQDIDYYDYRKLSEDYQLKFLVINKTDDVLQLFLDELSFDDVMIFSSEISMFLPPSSTNYTGFILNQADLLESHVVPSEIKMLDFRLETSNLLNSDVRHYPENGLFSIKK